MVCRARTGRAFLRLRPQGTGSSHAGGFPAEGGINKTIMQTDPAACHRLIGPLAALLRRHGAAPTGPRGRPVRCRSVTMSGVVVPVPAGPRRPNRLTKRRPMVLMDVGVGHVEATGRSQVACCPHDACIGLAVPTGRSVLVAEEDRSAGGVRDQTGPGNPTGTRLVHVWSTRHRNPAVRSGLQRCIIRPGRRNDPGEISPAQISDKDEVLR